MLLRVTARRRETHDTISFIFEPVEGPLPAYAPGQFLTFLIDHYGREVRRSFSLTSSPGDPFLSITVKRKPNGEISRFLQDHVSVGATLRVVPPAGRFTFQTRQPGAAPLSAGGPANARAGAPAPRDIGFIAAGSGIAPILPLIRQALREEPQSHVWLIDQNHSEADIIFAEALRALEGRVTRISLLSAPKSHTILPRRLNNANLEQFVGELTRFDPSESVFFCCGPEALMRMARFTLRVMGFGEAQFRQEHFTIDPPPKAALPVNTTTRQVALHIGGRAYTFPVTFPTNILQAALDHHVPLPYSCRGGRCSACSARCTDGKVLMSLNEVLTDQDLAEGWVLTCTGYALTDLSLEA